MALVAGYFATESQSTDSIRQRVETFVVGLDDEPGTSKHRIAPYASGHIIVKSRLGFPLEPVLEIDASGNILGLLGYTIDEKNGSSLLISGVTSSGGSLEQLEGQFVAVLVSVATGVVHIVNDRFSSRPLYVTTDRGIVYFSSNLAFLFHLSASRYRPDVQGWLEVATVGHTLGSRTTAASVKRLRPATHLTIGANGVKERQYWHLRHRPDPQLDAVAHSREVFGTFSESTARRVALVPRGVLALSGGLDSRLIAGAMPKDVDYSAFTFQDEAAGDSTPETRVASEVCSALHLRHHVKALPSESAAAKEVIRLTGGMRPYQHMAIVMAYVQEIRRLRAGFLIGGGPGDVLAGAYIPAARYVDPSRTTECLKDALRQRLDVSQLWPLIFRDDVMKTGRRAVRGALEESVATVIGPTAAHTITAWAMVYRQPAFTFTSLLHTHPEVTEAACHLGYRYTDLMLALPAAWLYKKRFYAFMIYTQLPQLRHIPYANTGELLSGSPPDLEITRESAISRVWRQLYGFSRRSAARVYRSVRPAPGTDPSLFFRDLNLLNEVQEAVHSIALLREILEVRRCDELIDRTKRGECRSEEILGTLTSLALSARVLPT